MKKNVEETHETGQTLIEGAATSVQLEYTARRWLLYAWCGIVCGCEEFRIIQGTLQTSQGTGELKKNIQQYVTKRITCREQQFGGTE